MSLGLKEWTNSAVSKVTDYSKLDDSLNAKEKKISTVSRDIPSAAKKTPLRFNPWRDKLMNLGLVIQDK